MLDVLKEYATKRADLLKMEATEKTSITAGTFTYILLASIAALFFIVLLNIGLGFLIGSYLGNYAYGLLIMAGFYFLLLIIIMLSRNAIKNGIANKIIKAINE